MLAHSAVLVVFLALVASETDDASSPGVDKANASATWVRHIQAVERFECRVPQPRAFKINELLVDGELGSADIAVPHSTILHRCDSSTGCCRDFLKECKVAKVETLNMLFYVVNSVTNAKGLKTFTLTNHTLCSCQLTVNDIK